MIWIAIISLIAFFILGTVSVLDLLEELYIQDAVGGGGD